MQIIDDFSHLICKCQLGAGNRQCEYLYKQSKVYACSKNTPLSTTFEKESETASADNCNGYNTDNNAKMQQETLIN